MDVEQELADGLACGIMNEIDFVVSMVKRGYELKVETWIEHGSSPFPNQDRKWKTNWIKETN